MGSKWWSRNCANYQKQGSRRQRPEGVKARNFGPGQTVVFALNSLGGKVTFSAPGLDAGVQATTQRTLEMVDMAALGRAIGRP